MVVRVAGDKESIGCRTRLRQANLCVVVLIVSGSQASQCPGDLWSAVQARGDLESARTSLEQLDSLQSSYLEGQSTLFVASDSAYLDTFHSSDRAASRPSHALHSILFTTLPQPKTLGELLIDQVEPTVLSQSLGNSSFDLIFTSQDGSVAVTAGLPGVGVAHIVDSLFACGTWVHVVDSILQPPALDDEQSNALYGAPGSLLLQEGEGTHGGLQTLRTRGQNLVASTSRKLLSAGRKSAKNAHSLLGLVVGGVVGCVAVAAVAVSMLGCFGPQPTRAEDCEQGIGSKGGSGIRVRSDAAPIERKSSVEILLAGLKGITGKKLLRSGSMESTASRLTALTGTSTSSGAKSPCIGRGDPYRVDQQLARFIPSSRLAQQMRQQSAASCESLDDENQTGASIASLRSATSSSWEMNSWEIDSEEVQICLDSKNRPWQLGSGGFGKVFRAEMAGSTPVAVKFVTRQSPRELQRFVHEIGILKSLRHTNIVQFLGAFLEGEQMILVTEYMVGGDLWNVLGHDTEHNFSWYKRGQHVALDFVRGVVHMHSRHIIHLDLKSANLLLARDGTAKIADVGLAKILSRENTQVSMQSTFDWAAPEVLAGTECSGKADVWSMGVVLWEICSGESPKMRQLRALRVPEECPAEVRDVIVACRASNPADRPTAKEVFRRLSAVVHRDRPRPASSMLGSPSLWSQQAAPFHGKPSWAPPEHAEGEEAPSFMACIHENRPADVSQMDSGASLRQQIQRGRNPNPKLPPVGSPGGRPTLEQRLSLSQDLKTRTMSI